MTYQNTADLANDPNYRERLSAAAFTEALGKPGDGLADFILRNPPMVAFNVFGPPVASSPGFGDKFATGGQAAVTDGDLLSAVQANWARLAGLYAPPAP
jgi:hypothetical protein